MAIKLPPRKEIELSIIKEYMDSGYDIEIINAYIDGSPEIGRVMREFIIELLSGLFTDREKQRRDTMSNSIKVFEVCEDAIRRYGYGKHTKPGGVFFIIAEINGLKPGKVEKMYYAGKKHVNHRQAWINHINTKYQ